MRDVNEITTRNSQAYTAHPKNGKPAVLLMLVLPCQDQPQ